MKIAGRKIDGPNEIVLVIPRGNSEDIVFKCVAVTSFEEFENVAPMPLAPKSITPQGEVENRNDPNYRLQLQAREIQRMAWMTLKSLEPSDVEWDTVDMDDPKTWSNYNQELQDAGFSTVEISRIGNAVLEANALDEAKLEAARQSFLHGLEG